MWKVEAAGFPDDNEPLWSTNFKRSIASLLQVELRSAGEAGVDNQIYTNREVIALFFLFIIITANNNSSDLELPSVLPLYLLIVLFLSLI